MTRRLGHSVITAAGAALLLAACAGGESPPGDRATPPPAASPGPSSGPSPGTSPGPLTGSSPAAGPPAGPSSPAPALPAVTVVRTGGFAGVDDRVDVAPDGTWSATGGVRGPAGRLSEEQRATLARLAADPGLAAEAADARPPTSCADAFTYELTVRATRVSFVDCPEDGASPRVAAGIVQLLRQAVWD